MSPYQINLLTTCILIVVMLAIYLFFTISSFYNPEWIEVIHNMGAKFGWDDTTTSQTHKGIVGVVGFIYVFYSKILITDLLNSN